MATIRIRALALIFFIAPLAADVSRPISAPQAPQQESLFFFLGGILPFTYNNTSAQTTSTDTRMGLGIATGAEFSVSGHRLGGLITFSKNQLLSQRVDGAANSNICDENLIGELFNVPGACTLYQLRAQPVYIWNNFLFGGSLVYNHTTNTTYFGSKIYNTNWSSVALGPLLGFRQDIGSMTLAAILHFDYAVTTIVLTTEKLRSWQLGATFYVLAKIF